MPRLELELDEESIPSAETKVKFKNGKEAILDRALIFASNLGSPGFDAEKIDREGEEEVTCNAKA